MMDNNIAQDQWLFHRGDIIHFDVPPNVSLPIYVIGDSHVRILVDAAPYIFKSSQVDIEDVFISKTAYAIGEEKYLNDAINNIPEGSNVLLSFGEIDCRHYVPKRAKDNGRSIQFETNRVFARYVYNTVRVLSDRFKVAIMGVYCCPDDHEHENDFDHIYIAKEHFNYLMKEFCEMKNLCYVPLFDVVNDNNWDILKHDYPHYFNDSSHLGACMIPYILNSISKHNI